MQLATAAHERARRDRSILSSPNAEPRVLRVALVDRGRIVDERIFDRVAVSIGPTEKQDFVLETRPCNVLEPSGSTYVLRVPEGATALVADGDRHRVLRGGESAQLEPTSRGRITMESRTLLFQVTPRPPKPRAAPLAASLRSGLEVDWTTTVIAAFSFLVHFGLVGAVYSDWLDPVSDDSLTVSAVIEAVRELPPAPPTEEPKPIDDTSTQQAPEKAKAAPTQTAAGTRATTGATRSGAPGHKSIGDARAAELARELQGLDFAMVATLNAKGTSTDKVIGDGKLPFGPLDAIAAEPKKVGLQFGSSALPGKPSGDSLLDLARNHNGPQGPDCPDCGLQPGPDRPRRPGPTPPDSPPLVPGGEIPGAGGVIGGLSGGFRRCYERGLRDENPNMQGTVRMLTTVGPNGEVASVTPSVGGSLSGGVVSCIVGKMRNAQFQPPTSGQTTTLMVPVTLNPQ